MKIKINENETYEIKLNEEVSLNELKDLMRKVEALSNPTFSSQPLIPTPTINLLPPKRKYNIIKEELKGVKCINCGSQRIYKKGFTKSGVRRLVCKNCNISFTIQKEGEIIVPVKQKRRKGMKWNKENVVKALKIHYFGSKAEKVQFAEDNQNSWENVMKSIHGLRTRYNIPPQEIGLQEYPTIKCRKIQKNELKIIQPQEPIIGQAQSQSFNQIPTPTPPLELKKDEKKDSEGIPHWWNRK